MKKYSFLLKPIFFIFNILFATWLTFKIEKITPTDFGRYRSLFEDEKPAVHFIDKKTYLKKICSDYKNNLIDSAALDLQLQLFLESPAEEKAKPEYTKSEFSKEKGPVSGYKAFAFGIN